MKTLELKLKKDVLIVDLQNIDVNNKPKIIQDSFGFWIYFKIKGHKPAKIEIPHTFFDYKNYKNYKFLCKGSELTEEIAMELVENKTKHKFENKVLTFYNYENLESFISAVESKGFYWLENPIKRIELKEWKGTDYTFGKYMIEFNKAEEKTFRNPLIFIKNE